MSIGGATGARLGVPTNTRKVVLTVDSETVLDRRHAERLDKTYEQADNEAREQINEAIFQRIIVEKRHISQHELGEPFRSML